MKNKFTIFIILLTIFTINAQNIKTKKTLSIISEYGASVPFGSYTYCNGDDEDGDAKIGDNINIVSTVYLSDKVGINLGFNRFQNIFNYKGYEEFVLSDYSRGVDWHYSTNAKWLHKVLIVGIKIENKNFKNTFLYSFDFNFGYVNSIGPDFLFEGFNKNTSTIYYGHLVSSSNEKIYLSLGFNLKWMLTKFAFISFSGTLNTFKQDIRFTTHSFYNSKSSKIGKRINTANFSIGIGITIFGKEKTNNLK